MPRVDADGIRTWPGPMRGGHSVTVWNRTSANVQQSEDSRIVPDGAHQGPSPGRSDSKGEGIHDRNRRAGARPGMICRIWHGWTTPVNADAYEALLRAEIFHGIARREISGYRGSELFRRTDRELVEFVTMMRFDSLDAVRSFAGPEYELAVVPPAARAP